MLAQRVQVWIWSNTVRAEYRRCWYLAVVLPWPGRRVSGESADEDIQTHAKAGAGITWKSDEGAQKDKLWASTAIQYSTR